MYNRPQVADMPSVHPPLCELKKNNNKKSTDVLEENVASFFEIYFGILLKMEAIFFFETSVGFQQNMHRYTPEDVARGSVVG
jgi:hypothetical protein